MLIAVHEYMYTIVEYLGFITVNGARECWFLCVCVPERVGMYSRSFNTPNILRLDHLLRYTSAISCAELAKFTNVDSFLSGTPIWEGGGREIAFPASIGVLFKHIKGWRVVPVGGYYRGMCPYNGNYFPKMAWKLKKEKTSNSELHIQKTCQEMVHVYEDKIFFYTR